MLVSSLGTLSMGESKMVTGVIDKHVLVTMMTRETQRFHHEPQLYILDLVDGD